MEEEEEEISDPQEARLYKENDIFPTPSLSLLKLRVITFIFQYLQPNVDTRDEKYQMYLKEVYDAANPNTCFGKATRQLLSFEENKYFHLVICHVHLKQFFELYHLTRAFEITTFYCYCNSRTCNSEPDQILHLHFLTYIPDFEHDFKKNVWNKLLSKSKKDNYKKCIRIKTFFHYYNVICYVSEKRACNYKSAEKKHFLINNPISKKEELKLLLVYPILAIKKILNYSSVQCLQHYDIYHKYEESYYYSRLDDLFTQIGFYSNIYLTDMKGFDFSNRTTFTMNGTVKDILLRSFGKDAHFIWKDNAKEYCKSLFVRKVIQPTRPQEIENYILISSGGGGSSSNNIQITSDAIIINPTNDIDFVISVLKLRAYNKNVKLYGKRQDIEIFKQMVFSHIQRDYYYYNIEGECSSNNNNNNSNDENFTIIHKNEEFQVFYEFTDY